MATADRFDPYRTYHFDVVVEGMLVGGFSEVTGISARREMVEYRNGNAVTSFASKLPCRDAVDDVTLRRGYTLDNKLWAWHGALSAGSPDRRNVAITLKDEARKPVLTWELEAAWILSLMGPSFNALANEVGIEEMKLACEAIHLVVEGAPA